MDDYIFQKKDIILGGLNWNDAGTACFQHVWEIWTWAILDSHHNFFGMNQNFWPFLAHFIGVSEHWMMKNFALKPCMKHPF